MKAQILISILLIGLVVSYTVLANNMSVNVEPISNNIVIHQQLKKESPCEGIDPFSSGVYFFDIVHGTKDYNPMSYTYTGTLIDVYGVEWSSGSTTASFSWKFQPSSDGKIAIKPPNTVAWSESGLDPSSVYKVTLSWPYKSYNGNGYVDYILGSNIYIKWYRVYQSDVKLIALLSNGSAVVKYPAKDFISTSYSVNTDYTQINWTWVINIPDLVPAGTGVSAIYVAIPDSADDYNSPDMVETIGGQDYVVVTKIVFTSGYTVSQDDTISIKWVTDLIG